MKGAGVLIIGISAATGACFAALAGLSIGAMAVPVRRFHVFSIVVAAVASCLGYLAFRTAIAGKIDEDTAVESLRRGMLGGLVGLILIFALLVMFRSDTQGFLAHALGRPASSFTTFRLMVASVLLGFGTGFAVVHPQ